MPPSATAPDRARSDCGLSPGQRAAIAWLRDQRAFLDELPLPGRGDTAGRWRQLVTLGAADLPRARIAEGHLDALAILAELGGTRSSGATWGVWTAQPTRLHAQPSADGWHLTGLKDWCSGATELDAALVSATAPDGPRLFVVRPRDLDIVPGSWPAVGMEATASYTLAFDVDLPGDAALGPPDAYVCRPGFWHGGAGVAACWFGGSLGLADWLRRAAHETDDPHVRRAWGRTHATLEAASALLARSAAEIDQAPHDLDGARQRALTLRLFVQNSASVVITETIDALGAGSMAHDRDYAQRVADLQLYIRQLRAEPAAAELGTMSSTPLRW